MFMRDLTATFPRVCVLGVESERRKVVVLPLACTIRHLGHGPHGIATGRRKSTVSLCLMYLTIGPGALFSRLLSTGTAEQGSAK